MEVRINREIRDYTESMFFGLSLRQFFFSVLPVRSYGVPEVQRYDCREIHCCMDQIDIHDP